MSQTFKVTATPRQRFWLGWLLLNQKIKLTKRSEDKTLYRSRKALGLLELSECYQRFNKDPGPLRMGRLIDDNTTRNLFEVTNEQAEFVLAQVDKVERPPDVSGFVVELLEQLEDRKDDPDIGNAEPVDEKAEAEGWKPSLNVLLENPTLTVQVLRDLVEKTESYGAFRKAFLEASANPTDTDIDG